MHQAGPASRRASAARAGPLPSGPGFTPIRLRWGWLIRLRREGAGATQPFERHAMDLTYGCGTKYCRPVHSTEHVAGFGIGPFAIGPYGAPYLLID